MNKVKKSILFVCTGNSCRSQMAEGYMRHFFGEMFDVYSAGLAPSSVNPRAIRIMKEDGIDISAHTSDPIEKYLDMSFDYVITVCDHANESCPMFSGIVKNRLHWSFEDPAHAVGTEEEIMAKFREVRDLIKTRITGHFKSINN